MKQIQEIPTIECTGFTLRPFRTSDAASLVRHINSSHISDRVTNVPSPYTQSHALSWLEKMSANYTGIKSLGESPARIDFAIAVDDEVVGSIAFIDIKGHVAQMSYWLSQNHQGKGIMTEAVQTVVKFGLESCGFDRIWGYTWSDNLASQRVLLRAGFTLEGVHRKVWAKNGKLFDSHVYAVVSD